MLTPRPSGAFSETLKNDGGSNASDPHTNSHPWGEFVGDRFVGLCEAMEIEGKLRDVWQWLPREMEAFSVDLFADAVVAYPGAGYPYEPQERVIQLVEESDTLRCLGATIFKAVANEVFCRAALDGMGIAYVYEPPILAATVDWNPELFKKAGDRDNCTVLVHDDLPDRTRCGIDTLDERVCICCHDTEKRALRAWIDTDAPEAREWALSIFERYYREARPVDQAALETPVSEQFISP